MEIVSNPTATEPRPVKDIEQQITNIKFNIGNIMHGYHSLEAGYKALDQLEQERQTSMVYFADKEKNAAK